MASRIHSKVHSCNHCASVLLDASKVAIDKETGGPLDMTELDLGVTLKSAIESAKDGCSFFASILPNQDRAHWVEYFENADSTRLVFRYNKVLSDQIKPWFGAILVMKDGRFSLAYNFIEVYKHPILSSPPFLITEMANLDVASPESLRTASIWLNKCIQNHSGSCDAFFPHSRLERPKRMIEILPRPGKNNQTGATIRLVNTPIDVSYVALSYCWGQNQITTTTENLAKFESDIPLHILSKSVQDAVSIAQGLDLRYIWVDCLCIVQDDGNELASEVNKMVDIYQRACVTLIASSSSDSAKGFLGTRADVPSFQVAYLSPDGRLTYIVLQPRDHVLEEPTNTRAWCMQEAVVSRRSLSYTSRGMSWHCSKEAFSDGGYPEADPTNLPIPKKILRDKDMHGTFSKNGLFAWHLIVEQYSCRAMTIPSDKLPGIAGLAGKFAWILDDSYVAGFWDYSIHMSLAWYFNRFHHSVIQDQRRFARPVEYRAPSWSWASMDGPVQFPMLDFRHPDGEDYQFLSEILSVSTWPVFPLAPYGQIESASLHLRGPMRRAKWGSLQNRNKNGCVYITGEDNDCEFEGTVLANPDTSEAIPDGDIVWMLLLRPYRISERVIGHLEGLILKEVPLIPNAAASPQADVFRRVAHFYVPTEYREAAESWAQQAFHIREIVLV